MANWAAFTRIFFATRTTFAFYRIAYRTTFARIGMALWTTFAFN